MKQFKTLLLVAILTIGLGATAHAQKTAHINYDRVIANMPEARTLSANLEKLQKTYLDDIKAEAKKLGDTFKKYEAEAKSQTEEVNAKRAQEIQEGRMKIQNAEQAAYQEIQKKYQEGLNPIKEKALKAINEVATAKGILYVLPSNILLVSKGEDLYESLKAKLGLLKDLPPKQQTQR